MEGVSMSILSAIVLIPLMSSYSEEVDSVGGLWQNVAMTRTARSTLEQWPLGTIECGIPSPAG